LNDERLSSKSEECSSLEPCKILTEKEWMILALTSNTSDHLQCIREALIKCRKMQLVFNPDKTFLGVNRRMLLGYVVSEKIRESDLEKIKVISGLATPTNAKGIAKLLGHVDWYRKLNLDFAKIAVPIT
jgi:hypothetical protein